MKLQGNQGRWVWNLEKYDGLRLNTEVLEQDDS